MENLCVLWYARGTVKPTIKSVVIFLLRWIVLTGLAYGAYLLVSPVPMAFLLVLPRASLAAAAGAVVLTLVRRTAQGGSVAVYLSIFLPVVILTFAVPVLVPEQDIPEVPPVALPVPQILPGRSHALYIDGQLGGELSRVVVARLHDNVSDVTAPRLTYHREGFWNTREATVQFSGETSLSTDEIAGLGAPALPALLRTFAGDLGRVVSLVHFDPFDRTAAGTGLRQLLHGVVLAAALTMTWTLVRLTRWPLINVLLSFLYVYLLFALPRLLGHPMVQGLLAGISLPRGVAEYLVVMAWGVCAVVLLGGALLQSPLTHWQREVYHVAARAPSGGAG